MHNRHAQGTPAGAGKRGGGGGVLPACLPACPHTCRLPEKMLTLSVFVVVFVVGWLLVVLFCNVYRKRHGSDFGCTKMPACKLKDKLLDLMNT